MNRHRFIWEKGKRVREKSGTWNEAGGNGIFVRRRKQQIRFHYFHKFLNRIVRFVIFILLFVINIKKIISYCQQFVIQSTISYKVRNNSKVEKNINPQRNVKWKKYINSEIEKMIRLLLTNHNHTLSRSYTKIKPTT